MERQISYIWRLTRFSSVGLRWTWSCCIPIVLNSSTSKARSILLFSTFALALRAALRAGRSGERMYGESLALALAVHLLREYAGQPVEPPIGPGELSREKLMRAVDYIEDRLHEELTVAGIGRAVHMSPFHFTRLFKKATGQSPYRYVIEARAKRAKALLQSRKFSISEVAHQVGFADQSHLTHHVKRFYGVTPKMLLDSQI